VPDLDGGYVVETEWLADHLNAPDLVVLDGSWHLPTSGRDARAEYHAEHIPGALFFDIEDLSDERSPLPHMLPSTVKFASRMKRIGLGDGMRVVVYDSAGLFSAARVWWTFRAMGKEDVAVLNGGLPKWKREGRPVTDELPSARTPRHFTPRFNAGLVCELADVRALVEAGAGQIADARGERRFAGLEPEPRPNLRAGHIPGSRNLPYASLLNTDGTLKPAESLQAAFAAAGIDTRRPVVTTCGSGVTAAILSLTLALIGQPNSGVYDGSWAEWGQEQLDTPVASVEREG